MPEKLVIMYNDRILQAFYKMPEVRRHFKICLNLENDCNIYKVKQHFYVETQFFSSL